VLTFYVTFNRCDYCTKLHVTSTFQNLQVLLPPPMYSQPWNNIQQTVIYSQTERSWWDVNCCCWCEVLELGFNQFIQIRKYTFIYCWSMTKIGNTDILQKSLVCKFTWMKLAIQWMQVPYAHVLKTIWKILQKREDF